MHIKSMENTRTTFDSKNFMNILYYSAYCILCIIIYTTVYADDQRESKSTTPHLMSKIMVMKYVIGFLAKTYCKYEYSLVLDEN